MSSKTPARLAGAVLAIVGGVVASIALIVGSRLGGPFVRATVGTPLDFGSDYTSPEALGQAVATLLASLFCAFAAAGAAVAVIRGRVTRRQAWWVANPVSMLAAWSVHYSLSGGALGWSHLPYEYYGLTIMALLVLGCWVYVGAVLLGGARVTLALGGSADRAQA